MNIIKKKLPNWDEKPLEENVTFGDTSFMIQWTNHIDGLVTAMVYISIVKDGVRYFVDRSGIELTTSIMRADLYMSVSVKNFSSKDDRLIIEHGNTSGSYKLTVSDMQSHIGLLQYLRNSIE